MFTSCRFRIIAALFSFYSKAEALNRGTQNFFAFTKGKLNFKFFVKKIQDLSLKYKPIVRVCHKDKSDSIIRQ